MKTTLINILFLFPNQNNEKLSLLSLSTFQPPDLKCFFNQSPSHIHAQVDEKSL